MSQTKAKKRQITLRVRVAKTSELGPNVAEHIYATLHGMCRKRTWWQKLFGVNGETASFEIASLDRQIAFYIHAPIRLRSLLEGQVYAQYPDAEIDEIDDYLPPHADNAVAVELSMTDPVIFPIKRYTQFEDKLTRTAVDPIAGVTATIAHLPHGHDSAAIQIVVRPLDAQWRLIYLKCLRLVARGIFANIESWKKAYIKAFITRSIWIKMVLFPLYIYFWFRGIFSGAKNIHLAMPGEESDSEAELNEQVSTAHDRESDIDAALSKISKLLFESTIRFIYLPDHRETARDEAEIKLQEMVGAFKQFEVPHLNGFHAHRWLRGSAALSAYKDRQLNGELVMNTEELATLYHMPHMSVSTPNIAWVRSRKLEPPHDLPIPASDIDPEMTVLGMTNFRGMRHSFGMKTIDRRRHMYVIGKTGMGKSTLLENMIYADIQSGKGVAIVDPHGDLAEHVIDFVPSHRTNDVIIIDPSDRDFPVGFNMLENIDPTYATIVASGLIGIFKKIYAESWGPRLEHILRNTILALLEYPSTTMLGITRILQDSEYRRRVVKKITDPIVKSFWINEFEKMEPRMRVEAISPILNKVGQFLSSPLIRNIVGQPKSSVNFRFAMDKKKIVIVNLSKGKIGEDVSSLLGAMIITKFQLDAMSRANIPEAERSDFYLYVDEFQNFATESFATILSEARKYRLSLIMANQYIAQMDEKVRDAVFGNVGSLASFQVGFDDAEMIAGQFGGDETMVADLVSLSMGSTYLRLLIDGMPTPVFSMSTFPPKDREVEDGRREKIIKFCRERYSMERAVIEDKIKRWTESKEEEKEEGKKG